MFSDLSCTTLSCDIPSFLDVHADEDPLAPLNFDDLLDIAHEFEFTRTITHIWPCEEPSICTEVGLEDIFAAVVHTPSAEGTPTPTPSIPLEPVPLQEIDWRGSVSTHHAPDESARISSNLVPPLKDDDQVQAKATCPITAILRGWSPPDGSQFLDLDERLMHPQSAKGVWVSPWKAAFVSPAYTQLVPALAGSSPSPATVHVIGDILLQSSITESKALPVITVDKANGDPRPNAVPFVPPPAQCAVSEPTETGTALQDNARVPRQTATYPRPKAPKSRANLSSTPTVGGRSIAKYAKAPRGGIPPHIARTVTKANILRVEKERKVMRDAFSSTNIGEGKKPSVLRTAVRAERLCGGGGKKPFDSGANWERKEEQGRGRGCE